MEFAKNYYELNGYENIESPWMVDEEISNITKPKDKRNFFVSPDGGKGDKVLVASGEQSFLQLIKDGLLKLRKKYQTTTPCFRDESETTDLTKTYFMKMELIYWDYDDNENKEINNVLENCSLPIR